MPDVEPPSLGDLIARVPMSTAYDVAIAIAAFPAWSAPLAARRVRPLFELARRMRRDEEDLLRVLSEEMGKSLPDTRAEMKRATENVEAAEALIDHPAIAWISFVGSTRVARQVAARCASQGKRFQALGFARNHLVVMPLLGNIGSRRGRRRGS